MSLDADSVSPPDGQSSFSGIPGAQFLEDVDSYMKGEESADAKLKVENEPENGRDGLELSGSNWSFLKA